MTLRRGSAVSRGKTVGIVWDPRPESFAILPVRRGYAERVHQVQVESWADRLVLRQVTGAFVDARPRTYDAAAWETHREVSGELMCRLVRAVIRAARDDLIAERWEGARRHSGARAERCALFGS